MQVHTGSRNRGFTVGFTMGGSRGGQKESNQDWRRDAGELRLRFVRG